jgi:hypothetical protein
MQMWQDGFLIRGGRVGTSDAVDFGKNVLVGKDKTVTVRFEQYLPFALA